GSDLWIMDMATGKSQRVTSAAVMAKFQASARKVKEDREKKWKAAQKQLGAGALEGRLRLLGRPAKGTTTKNTSRSQMVTRNDARDHSAPRYSGIISFTWSPTAHELLFLSEWDIYRWKVGDKEPNRLTRTKAWEHNVQYLRDGKGYTYLVHGSG